MRAAFCQFVHGVALLDVSGATRAIRGRRLSKVQLLSCPFPQTAGNGQLSHFRQGCAASSHAAAMTRVSKALTEKIMR